MFFPFKAKSHHMSNIDAHKHLGSYSPNILKNILRLFLHEFPNLNVTQLLIG